VGTLGKRKWKGGEEEQLMNELNRLSDNCHTELGLESVMDIIHWTG